MHIPVLLNETLELLDPKPGEFIIDGTMDGGGHAEAILVHIGAQGRFLGADLDRELVAKTGKRLAAPNAIFIARNYAELPEALDELELPKADGLLLDLGFSSEQLSAGRGFSFEADEPLLMTYSDDMTPVRDLLLKIKEADLADIIYRYGDERMSRRIAKAIKSKRKIETSRELAEIIRQALPGNYERGRIHPATRTFQALRIYANREFENLERILEALPRVLAKGGRAAVISFHSSEDKIVKEGFRKLAKEGIAELIVKKPVAATREEIRENPRSRSAKIRAIKIL